MPALDTKYFGLIRQIIWYFKTDNLALRKPFCSQGDPDVPG